MLTPYVPTWYNLSEIRPTGQNTEEKMNPTNLILGQNIYRLRSEKQLSQEELAGLAGVSRQSVSKWETGTAVPELDKLQRLCEIFGVSLDCLVNGCGNEGSATPLEAESEYATHQSNVDARNKPQERARTPLIDMRDGRKIFAYIFFAVALISAIAAIYLSAPAFLVFTAELIVAELICIFSRRPLLFCTWYFFFLVYIHIAVSIGGASHNSLLLLPKHIRLIAQTGITFSILFDVFLSLSALLIIFASFFSFREKTGSKKRVIAEFAVSMTVYAALLLTNVIIAIKSPMSGEIPIEGYELWLILARIFQLTNILCLLAFSAATVSLFRLIKAFPPSKSRIAALSSAAVLWLCLIAVANLLPTTKAAYIPLTFIVTLLRISLIFIFALFAAMIRDRKLRQHKDIKTPDCR